MKGNTCGMHPAAVMKGKRPPCGRIDSMVDVEDHEVGYMLIGTSDLSQVCRILADYVEDISEYRFFTRVLCMLPNGLRACGVFASSTPGAQWYGADGSGRYAV